MWLSLPGGQWMRGGPGRRFTGQVVPQPLGISLSWEVALLDCVPLNHTDRMGMQAQQALTGGPWTGVTPF